MDDKMRRIAPIDLLMVNAREIRDVTGVDEVTALQIASAHEPAPRDQVSLGIAADLEAALYAPPTANEPPRPLSAYSTGCPDCGGHGWYKEAVPYGHPNFGKLFPCRCKTTEQRLYRRQRQDQILAQLADELGMLSGKRLETFDTDHTDSAQQQRLRDACQAVNDYICRLKGWLYIWGPCGVGKSHLAAAVANAAAEADWRVSYASVPSLLRFLKAGFNNHSADQRMVELQVVDILVVDDLGAEYHRPDADGYDYNDSVLFELINSRYLESRLTIITSNMPPDDHEPRIAARIKRHSRVIHVDVDDYMQRQRGTP